MTRREVKIKIDETRKIYPNMAEDKIEDLARLRL